MTGTPPPGVKPVGIFVLTRVDYEVLTLYTHPNLQLDSLEFVTTYHLLSGIIERTQLNSTKPLTAMTSSRR